MTLSVIKATKVLPWLDVIVMALPAPVMDETAAPVARIVCARVRFRLDDTWVTTPAVSGTVWRTDAS
jgi:hypothetical protein